MVVIIVIDKTPNACNDYEVITSFPFTSSDVNGDIRIGYLGTEKGDLAIILSDIEIPFETFGTDSEEGFANALCVTNINSQLAKFTLDGTATFSYRFRGIPYRYEFIPYENKKDRDNYFYDWISGKRHVTPLNLNVAPPPNPEKLYSMFDTQNYFSSDIFQMTENDSRTRNENDKNILPGYETEEVSVSNIHYAISKARFGELDGKLPIDFVKHYERGGYKKILSAYAANKPPPHFDSILAWELVFKVPVPTFPSTPILLQYRKPEKHGYAYGLFSGHLEIGMTAIKVFGPGKYEYGEVINKELPMYNIPIDFDADDRIIDPERVLKDFDKLMQRLCDAEIASTTRQTNPHQYTRRVFIPQSRSEAEGEGGGNPRKPKTSMHIHYRLPKDIYVENYSAYLKLVKKAIRLVREKKGSYLSLWDSTLEVSSVSETKSTTRLFLFEMRKQKYAVYLNGKRYVVNFARKKDIRDFSTIFFAVERKIFIDEISTLRLPGAYKFGERCLVPYKEENEQNEITIFEQIESALCHINYNRVCSTTGKRLEVSKTDPEAKETLPSGLITNFQLNTGSNLNSSEVDEIVTKFLLRMNDNGRSNFRKLPAYDRYFVNLNRFCLLCNSIHDGSKKTSITVKNNCVLLNCYKTSSTEFIMNISEL